MSRFLLCVIALGLGDVTKAADAAVRVNSQTIDEALVKDYPDTFNGIRVEGLAATTSSLVTTTTPATTMAPRSTTPSKSSTTAPLATTTLGRRAFTLEPKPKPFAAQ